jgi:endonuclease G
MVPAEDLAFSDASIQATFLLSNVAPQRQALNAGRWRQLENAVRAVAAHSDAVYVFTGPVFDSPQTAVIGTSRVAVPTHFYKVILAVEGERKILYAAILPNAEQVAEGLNRFATTVDEVERRTGLDFFSALADSEESALESILRVFPAPGTRTRNALRVEVEPEGEQPLPVGAELPGSAAANARKMAYGTLIRVV